MESKRKENKKRCKLTKELFDLLSEMCSEITPYYRSWFRNRYSKRKTIELKKIDKIIFDVYMAAAIKSENPEEAYTVLDKYYPKLVLYTSSIHTNNK